MIHNQNFEHQFWGTARFNTWANFIYIIYEGFSKSIRGITVQFILEKRALPILNNKIYTDPSNLTQLKCKVQRFYGIVDQNILQVLYRANSKIYGSPSQPLESKKITLAINNLNYEKQSHNIDFQIIIMTLYFRIMNFYLIIICILTLSNNYYFFS